MTSFQIKEKVRSEACWPVNPDLEWRMLVNRFDLVKIPDDGQGTP